MRARAVRRVALLGLVGLALASAGCRGLVDRLRGRDRPAGGPAASATAPGGRVAGLAASGFGPVLSWQPVAGAGSYAVTVGGGSSPWLWVGAGTSVPYGTLEDGRDPMLPPQSDRPLQVVQAVPGTKYRWFVTALDGRGDAIASSGLAEFTYQPPAGVTQLPPRPPRAEETPVYDCDTLVPEAMRQRLLAGYQLEESSPCGERPRAGCPWSCDFSKREGATRRRVGFYYDCARWPHVDMWQRAPSLKNGRDYPGVGRRAVVAAEDEQTKLLLHARQANCIIQLAGNLGEARLVELGRAADAALTARVVGISR